MAVSEIHHVTVVVSDLERSERFYVHLLGYRPTLRMRVGGADTEEGLGLPPGTTGEVVYLQGPTRIGQVELVRWDTEPGTQARTSYRDLGPMVICFSVDDAELEAAYARARELGARLHSVPHRSRLDNYGEIGVFVAEDPDGTMVEFVSLPSPEQVRAVRAARTGQNGDV